MAMYHTNVTRHTQKLHHSQKLGHVSWKEGMVHYLTLGYDCSPAGALRAMGLRSFALPFDWLVSPINAMEACLKDDFAHFHTNLRLNHKSTRIVDHYGFEFNHDYPTATDDHVVDHLNEDWHCEKEIVKNWRDCTSAVLDKYHRRIERFRNILQDRNMPILVLCRRNVHEVKRLQDVFSQRWNRDNDVYFLVATQGGTTNAMRIMTFNPEVNGTWNDQQAWQTAFDAITKQMISSQPTAQARNAS
jgi:hypothetical protein